MVIELATVISRTPRLRRPGRVYLARAAPTACLPGGREVGVGLDAAVAAGGDQLGQDVADFLGFAGVVAALLAVAAGGEVGGGVVGGCMWRCR